MSIIQLVLSEGFYLKDPQGTDLGKNIINKSVKMFDELGFEEFTFKKLAKEINSTEASIYRYFENKHRLLVYLITWYWNWLEYRIDYSTHNIDDPVQRLKIALDIVCQKKKTDENFPEIDEAALSRIVIAESDKTYLTKRVDDINKEGLFRGYKSLCKRIASIIKEINVDYPYAHAISSTVLEAAHQQLFFAQHLPSLTEVDRDAESPHQQTYDFISDLVMKSILKPVQ